MIYYTADLHFGHEASVGKYSRPFLSVSDMDEILIDSWNAKVGEKDTVYIIGDFMSRASVNPAYYLQKLKGEKHLVVGNHERFWVHRCDLQRYFKTVNTYAEVKDGGQRVVMNHFPMVEWWGDRRGSILVYGHVHNRTAEPTFSTLKKLKNAYNAGVDINGFYPVTLDELKVNNRIFYQGGK